MTRTEALSISGMTCGHCVRAVQTALESLSGVDVGGVALGEAHVRYDSAVVDRAEIVKALEDEGYAVETQARV